MKAFIKWGGVALFSLAAGYSAFAVGVSFGVGAQLLFTVAMTACGFPFGIGLAWLAERVAR